MPLIFNSQCNEFEGEEPQNKYTIDDVKQACVQACTDWIKIGENASDFYFIVAYTQLCAYPHTYQGAPDDENGLTWIWDWEGGWRTIKEETGM